MATSGTEAEAQSVASDAPLFCRAMPVSPPPVPIDDGSPQARAIRVGVNNWDNGAVIHWALITRPGWNWPAAQADIVRWGFKTWADLGIGLKFVEVQDESEAEIKIGRLQGDGSWSFVGRDVLRFNDRGRTMNFGWDLTTQWGHATALHEIGHSLGLQHEHQNPRAGIVWDRLKVIADLSAPPNSWSVRQIEAQILNALPATNLEGSNWDPTSIMHYPFKPGLIVAPKPYDVRGIGNNVVLSPQDITWARTWYPPINQPEPIGLLDLRAIDSAPGAQTDFLFTAPATRRYKISYVGTVDPSDADVRIGVYEVRDGVPRAFADDADLGQPRTAAVSAKLVRKRQYVVRCRVLFAQDGVQLKILIV
jgi:hypothetical protein